MRLLKTLAVRTIVSIDSLIDAKDRRQMAKIESILREVSSNVENNMYDDHNLHGHDYTKIFYGASDNPPINEVDKEIHELMREVVKSLLPEEVANDSE